MGQGHIAGCERRDSVGCDVGEFDVGAARVGYLGFCDVGWDILGLEYEIRDTGCGIQR
jgi:hypothetical protein